jgi:hypothetical protein
VTVRLFGVGLAAVAHLLLPLTVWFLFPFLRGDVAVPSDAAPAWWLIDGLLVVQFGVLHSALLAPTVRNRLTRVLPRGLHGCLFCAVTCLSLLLLVLCWQSSPPLLYELATWPAHVVRGAYLLCWVGLVYSLYLTGIGNQTGWTPFWSWLRGTEQVRRFEPSGAYRLLRHPTYLFFLGQVWFTPLMTLDRALLNGLLTAYILLGSYLKDRRLVFYLGDTYRRYQAEVPGYPLPGLGPLGRVPLSRERSGAVP